MGWENKPPLISYKERREILDAVIDEWKAQGWHVRDRNDDCVTFQDSPSLYEEGCIRVVKSVDARGRVVTGSPSIIRDLIRDPIGFAYDIGQDFLDDPLGFVFIWGLILGIPAMIVVAITHRIFG
jgi:hypothetical protein